MFRTKSRTDVLKDRATTRAEQTADRAADIRKTAAGQAGSASDRAGALAATASDRASELIDRVGPAADVARERAAAAKEAAAHGVEVAAPKLEDAVHNLGPRVDTARDKIVDEYLPKVAEVIAALATSAALAKENAAHTAERAPDAFSVLKGEATVKRRKRRGGKLLILLGLVAAGAAGFAATRRKASAADPWATPVSDPYSASNNGSVTTKAAGLAAAAKDKVAGAVGGGHADEGTVPSTTSEETSDVSTPHLATDPSVAAATGTDPVETSENADGDAWTDAKSWADDEGRGKS